MWSPKASLSDFGPVFEKRKHKCTLGTERTLSNLQECAKKEKEKSTKRHHKDEQEYLYQLEVFSGLINYWNENANPIFVTP